MNPLLALGTAALKSLAKPIKGFIDEHFRAKVKPVAGSVVYCDLMLAAEHSGIHVADGKISNVVVTDFAEREIRWSNTDDFTGKSVQKRKIYVSSRGNQAVGSDAVAKAAAKRIGEKGFYGLVVKNCHQFSSQCVDAVEYDRNLLGKAWDGMRMQVGRMASTDWEPTLIMLKQNAEMRLGANKWLLWDLDGENSEPEPEPDWDGMADALKNHALSPQFSQYLQNEIADMQSYLQETGDENLPQEILQRLNGLTRVLKTVSDKYDEVKDLLAKCPNSGFSYNDIKTLQQNGIDFAELAKELAQNHAIRDLVRKMGRSYVAEEIKKRRRAPKAAQSEVYGTHRSGDVARVLPSELVNLEDEDLEMLFYAKMLEQGLQTYELGGTAFEEEEYAQQQNRMQTGPIVACLDTSGSMDGEPIRKARALLLAVAGILKSEKRSLHVILFGASGQLKELEISDGTDSPKLMRFLAQGFNGGTDFETPLKRALDIIEAQKDFAKADILMISDGDCSISSSTAAEIKRRKDKYDCMVYSVLCNGTRQSDNFSDETVAL